MPKKCILFRDTKNEKFWVPDIVWNSIKAEIPKLKRGIHSRGRQQVENRVVLGAILHIIYTGNSWNSLKHINLGCGASVANARYKAWRKAGVFLKLSKLNIDYQEKGGLSWAWLTVILKMIAERKSDLYQDDEELSLSHDSKSISAFFDSVPLDRLKEVMHQFSRIPELHLFYKEDYDLWAVNKTNQILLEVQSSSVLNRNSDK
jgi:hypothetical protein